MTIRSKFDAFALVVFILAAGGIAANFVTGCAGWGQKTCTIVDLANEACGIVRYMGEDGKVYEARVTQEDVREMAKAQARRDAGAQ